MAIEEGKLYVSSVIDGREVLKPAEMRDVQRWLWEKHVWSGARYVVLNLDWIKQMQQLTQEVDKDCAPFLIAQKLTDNG